MKIAIIGTGAMGSIYAGLLAEAGNEVWAIDLWKEHLDTIRDHGLRVEGHRIPKSWPGSRRRRARTPAVA